MKQLPIFLLLCLVPAFGQDPCTVYNRNLGPFPFYASDSQGHLSGNHQFINYTRGSCQYTLAPASFTSCAAVAKADSVSSMTESGKLTLGYVHETAVADAGGLATAAYPIAAVANAKGVGGVRECFAGCSFSVTLSSSLGSAQFSATSKWSKEYAYPNTCVPHTANLNVCSGAVTDSINPCGPSPILVDVQGEDFHFSGAVTFRFGSQLKKVSWPDWHYHNAWLVLPKNGVVDSADDLFGNYTRHSNADYTPFPNSTDANGWLALAFYDQPAQGGNGDGVLDRRDRIWRKLRLWRPAHCHLSPDRPCVALDSELSTLERAGIHRLGLTYTAVDEMYGDNKCGFVAPINMAEGERQRSADPKLACDFNLAEAH
jgi:hypothetical protein